MSLNKVSVVNCFQNCIFVLPNTAQKPLSIVQCCCKLLSKLYLCSTEYSQMPLVYPELVGCKLLSKLYLCSTEYSDEAPTLYCARVVNCFQNCIFVLPNTATSKRPRWKRSCKLLSKLYLCSTEYSKNTSMPLLPTVVNCFQNCIFVLPNTATEERRSGAKLL